MRRKIILLSLLLMYASRFTIIAQASTTGTIEFDKAAYSGLYSTARVTVKDQDLNVNPFVQNKTSVKIGSDTDSKGIILELSETGPNTGIFSGGLKFSTDASSSANGVIMINAASTITAEYTDLSNVVSVQAAFNFTEAVIKTSAENDFGTGNMLDVTIYEPDIDNPVKIDTITAKIGAGNSVADLTLHLEETGVNTGEFMQTVGFTDRESNSKLLYMLGMDKVNIKYVDQTVPLGGSKEIMKTIRWEYHSTVITLDKESYHGYNSSAVITLYNMELNNDSKRIDHVCVDVMTNNSKELSLELKETNNNSGVFTRTLYFGRNMGKSDNKIKMTGDDGILISYINRRNKYDIVHCSADWSPQDGQPILDRQAYSGNAAIVGVTLEDWDIAEDLAVKDEVRVVVRVPGSSRKRNITLSETKRDSGIFSGTFYINGGSDKSPTIELNPGDTLEVAYTDADTASGIEETRMVSAVWTGISKAVLTLDQAGYKGYGANMLVTLKDPDYNKNINASDSVEVLIKTFGRMGSSKYVLKETGNDTGVFTASLKLSTDWPNYSSIRVFDTDRITVTFVDKNVSVTADFSK